jgi:hypothetical protein
MIYIQLPDGFLIGRKRGLEAYLDLLRHRENPISVNIIAGIIKGILYEKVRKYSEFIDCFRELEKILGYVPEQLLTYKYGIPRPVFTAEFKIYKGFYDTNFDYRPSGAEFCRLQSAISQIDDIYLGVVSELKKLVPVARDGYIRISLAEFSNLFPVVRELDIDDDVLKLHKEFLDSGCTDDLTEKLEHCGFTKALTWWENTNVVNRNEALVNLMLIYSNVPRYKYFSYRLYTDYKVLTYLYHADKFPVHSMIDLHCINIYEFDKLFGPLEQFARKYLDMLEPLMNIVKDASDINSESLTNIPVSLIERIVELSE